MLIEIEKLKNLLAKKDEEIGELKLNQKTEEPAHKQGIVYKKKISFL